MTFKNFTNAQIGAYKLHELNIQAEWERARWLSCVIINPHLKRPISPKKVTTFPWEKNSSASNKHNINKIIKESEYQDKLKTLKNKSNA
tara:strand:+ start:584 stop:850 length:267 start_codon:yes stop_codon:yes gene_type:complete